MNRQEIARLLPYGADFLFLERVREVDHGKSIITSMRYEVENPMLAAHFLNGPNIVPGVLITEQVCQSALLLSLLSGELARGETFMLGRVQSIFQTPAMVPCEIIASVEIQVRRGDDIGFWPRQL